MKKGQSQMHLRILATTDIHMHLRGWDYYADRPAHALGLSRLARLIDEARAEAAEAGSHVVLVDNGDAQQGTPMGDLAATRPDLGPHPFMATCRKLGYDALGLGNHDFNFGIEALAASLSDAPCPVICSSLVWPSDPELPVCETAILTKGDVKIGILSVLPPQTLDWDWHLLNGRVSVDGVVETARRVLPALKAAGADVVIALAHTGIGPFDGNAELENAVRPLAALDGIDAIVAGHTHQLFPGAEFDGLDGVDAQRGTIHGKPVVMPGAAASHLGLIDLDLARDMKGTWNVAESRVSLRKLPADTPEDPDLVDLLAPTHDATRKRMDMPAGKTDRPLHSYFALFAPDEALRFIAAAQAHAVRQVLRDTGFDGLPVLSAVAPGKYGGRNGPLHYSDVPGGEISLRHLADLHVFPNELRAVVISGNALRDWLEVSASQFHVIPPGSRATPLINPKFPGHNFDVIHGVTYQIDVTQPARFDQDGVAVEPDSERITKLCLPDGQPIAPDARVVVAVNNYRTNGGGNVRALKGAQQIDLAPRQVTDIMRSYLASGDIDPIAEMPLPWTFRSVPETTVSVVTGPGARPHLDWLGNRLVSVDGPDTARFLRLTLAL